MSCYINDKGELKYLYYTIEHDVIGAGCGMGGTTYLWLYINIEKDE